jgi:hypothetical protein
MPEKKAVGKDIFHLPLTRREEIKPEITNRYQIPERSSKYPDTRQTATESSIVVDRDIFMLCLRDEE